MIAYCVCVYCDFIKKWITNGQHVKTKKPLKKRLAWVTAVNFRLTEKKIINPTQQVFGRYVLSWSKINIFSPILFLKFLLEIGISMRFFDSHVG